GLLCLATALNYLDRQSLSVLVKKISADLGMSNAQYSWVTGTFLACYGVMYLVAGRIIDRLGTRRGMLVFVSAWSVVAMLHGRAKSIFQLAVFRGLLGVTEAANFPACVKAVSEWFPVRERAMAIGFFNAGTAVGSALAAPVVSVVALSWGWR